MATKEQGHDPYYNLHLMELYWAYDRLKLMVFERGFIFHILSLQGVVLLDGGKRKASIIFQILGGNL